MKALYINPWTKTVTELNLTDGNSDKASSTRLQEMQGLVGGNIENIPWTSQSNDLYCNEEFLFQGWTRGLMFRDLNTWPDPILGPCIVVGHDGKGKSIDHSFDPLTFHQSFKWIQLQS